MSGIDLSKHHTDVRRIFHAHFSERVRRRGYDPEEVLQEVYRGILVRQQGRGRWDPSRGRGLGSYIYMCIDGITKNYHAKEQRRERLFSVGTYGYRQDDTYGHVDVASMRTLEDPSAETAMDGVMLAVDTAAAILERLDQSTPEGRIGRRYIYALVEGLSKTEARRSAGANNKVIALVEAATQEALCDLSE